MVNKSLTITSVVLITIVVGNIVYTVVQGLVWVFLSLFTVLVILALILDFIRDKFPNSPLGKVTAKVVNWFKKILEELIGWV
jgi:hypothetical protein